MPPAVPFNHYGSSRNQQNRTARPILLFHANIFRRRACFEHSNFFKVKVLVPQHAQWRAWGSPEGKARPDQYTRWGGPASQAQGSTTSFLTATTLIYAIGAGITAAAGTRLALQLVLVDNFTFYSLRSWSKYPKPLFLVTTSPRRDWVICAPAATLRCGSRFSGSLSGIEP